VGRTSSPPTLTGVFKSIRAVIPHMVARKSGRIIATASMAGRTGLPTVAHYCAAKWGVIGLIKSVAREVAADGVTVNCICPTNLDSDMIHNAAFYALFAPGIENPTREQVIPGFTSLNAIPDPVDRGDRHLQRDDVPGVAGGTLHHRRGTARQRRMERVQRRVSAAR